MPEEEVNVPSRFNTKNTLLFIFILSAICALILSALAAALQQPKEFAKELDRSKQMMMAADLLDSENNLSDKEILELYEKKFQPLLTNDQGEIKSFAELGIDQQKYVSEYRKTGYYKEPWKLFYKILPHEGYVIPINGYGLWDAIYGYLALEPDANTVIGISWYDQKETPGLGGNIAEIPWQSLFLGKKIFQENPSGKTDFKTAPLGITVVKGKVVEALGNSPKALSAVDGMAGATLTGNGVTDAYKTVLAAYRPFLIKMHNQYKKNDASR